MAHQQQIHQHVFENGLTLVAQSMPWLQSAAFSLSLPAGCQFDPADQLGLANLTCEMAFRGGAEFNNRELVEALEGIGCEYYSNAGIYLASFGGALPAENLETALSIYARMIRKAHLPEEQFEDGRNVCLQEIQSIEDDLPGRAMQVLRLRHYGQPFGRHADGEFEDVANMTLEQVREFYRRYYQPSGAILSVAGQLDWERLRDAVAGWLGDWEGHPTAPPISEAAQNGYHHIAFDSNQTHITLAWPSLAYRDPDYYLARCAVGVLSDGMSSRLFHEVREKRGLCYAISASCHSIRDRGAVFGYSGTTTESAQETLDVFLQEVQRLQSGVHEDELARLKVQFRSSLIMQQESCRSRVSTITGDLFHLGRVRTLDEINERINQMTPADINRYLEQHPPGPFDIVTLGEQPLEVPGGIPTTSAE